MRNGNNARIPRAGLKGALLGFLTTLALGTPVGADQISDVGDSPAAIAATAEGSASELAASLRSLDSSLHAAAPLEGSRVLSTEEHDALVEAAVKAQLAALANELDLLSASLAAGVDPALQKVLLASVTHRASVLSRLGARPARVPIPSELTSQLLALWHDVQALSVSLAGAPAPATDPVTESP